MYLEKQMKVVNLKMGLPEAERVLQGGESLSANVGGSAGETVQRSSDPMAFHRRGMASLDGARRGGRYVTAELVIQGLEKRLAAERLAKARNRAAKME